MGLLSENEPAAFSLENPAARGAFLLTADHAGRLIPKVLANLGLSEPDLSRHIAWDIGIFGVTTRLAHLLGATAILQTYSRLVIDCNRRPSLPTAFPALSEGTAIPGNTDLTEAEKLLRKVEVFDPYHNEIAKLVAGWSGPKPIYVAMHSFTPVYLGETRLMDVAVLYNRTPRLSQHLAALLRAEAGLIVAENEPYSVSDETDYGVPVHAERNGLDYVEIEIRQDLIASDAGQAVWAERLARLLPMALHRIQGAD